MKGVEVWREDVIVTAVRTTEGNYIIDDAGIVYRCIREPESKPDGAVPAADETATGAEAVPEGSPPTAGQS